MKTLKLTFLSLILGAMAFSLTNCGSKSGTADKSGPEYTSAYVCPMHCKGSGSDEPGKCSVCGMDMVKNMDHDMHKTGENDNAGHEHEGDADAVMYACTMHPEITGVEGDSCSICGMALSEVVDDGHEGHHHE